jgi:hypothetical protein
VPETKSFRLRVAAYYLRDPSRKERGQAVCDWLD